MLRIKVDPASRAGMSGLIKALQKRTTLRREVVEFLNDMVRLRNDWVGHPRTAAAYPLVAATGFLSRIHSAKLDTAFSQYVGVPLPQARSIADKNIQECDANLSKQESAQASTEASARAQASQAAAEAQASAQAAQDNAARRAIEEKACGAALSGQVKGGGLFADLCVSTSQSSSNDGSRTLCSAAQVAFQPDGTLSETDITSIKSGYPGCFP